MLKPHVLRRKGATGRFAMDERAGTGALRVATLNIWGRRGAWQERRRVLAEGFRELEPDLVAFQEAIVGEGYDQVIDILGPGYHLAHQTDRELGRGGDIEDGQGISIASRWPIGEVWEPDLNVTPRTEDFACGTIIAEVLVPEPVGALLFVNHLPNWQLTHEYERELQTAIVGRTIEGIMEGREDPRHAVLAGDLDATPEAASVRFWRGLQSLGGMSVCYRDAWGSTHPGELGHTFTAENPLVTAENWDWELELGRRIDHIFVRCSDHGPTLDIRACERIFDEPVDGVWGSDHFGFYADLSAQTSSGRPVR
jgi:endonuclease/exonuclease/phosphatase family metal-dependent hydrolase